MALLFSSLFDILYAIFCYLLTMHVDILFDILPAIRVDITIRI